MKFGYDVAKAMVLGLAVCVAGCGEDSPSVPQNDAPTVLLSAPSGGVTVAPGGTLDITWSSSDDGTVMGVDLSYTDDSQSGAFTPIAGDLAADGTFSWTVPNQATFGVLVKAVATDDGGLTGEDVSDGKLAVVVASPRNYVTSQVCANCHQGKFDAVWNSGHPHKIKKVENAQAPTYPHTSVATPPTGFSWSDLTYVIGGYRWKARFMDAEGYIITDGWNGVTAQYNIPREDLGGGLADEWVPYHAGDTAPKPYTCGTCHTTGWQTVDENGGVNQDGLVGIRGTWEEAGVTCEACHGTGGTHVASQLAQDININRNSELCGSCHFRDTNHRILASGGFIRHHEQFDEMISAGHTALRCTACHDPHVGVQHGNATTGIKVDCASCHGPQEQNNAHLTGFMGAPTCVDCHMPRASKSARKVQDHEGDVRTHIFQILPDPVGASDPGGMFFAEDGVTYSQGYLTLDFACYGCHKDESGIGGPNSMKSLAELAAKASGIHASTTKVRQVP